jgi:hypothetical protein
LAWLPSSLLILLNFLSTPKKSEQAASPLPQENCEKPGPQETIAKEKGERKGKPQKTLEKWAFLGRRVEIAAKNSV